MKDSYSHAARYFSDDALYNLKNGFWCVAQADIHFSHSWRHPLIRRRAAKRFGRLRRKHLIQESASSVQRWNNWKSATDAFHEVLTGDYHSY